MDAQHATTALQTLIALAGFLFVWNVLWPTHAADTLRQNLFSIRHKLFLSALRGEGGLSFEALAYRSTRASINAIINAAGVLSTWGLLFMALNDFRKGTLKKMSNSPSASVPMTDEQRAALAPTQNAISTEIAKYLFFRTPLLSTTLAACYIFCGIIYLCYRYVRRVCERRGFFNFNPAAVIRAQVKQSVTKEMTTVIRHVNEFDKVAPWSRHTEVMDRELACADH